MFTGLYTALITPFKNGKIDEEKLINLLESQINGGVDGIVPCGTTGESPTLTHEEHNKIIEICVKHAKNRIKIIAGTGSNSTQEAVSLTKHAKEIGADGCLIVAPYYNKPTKEGVIQHFTQINKCELPFLIYNIPGRSVIDICDQTLSELSNMKFAAGIKDATGDLSRLTTLRPLVKKDNFSYLSGEDSTAVGFNAMGGNGIISVTSNILPKECKEVQNLCQNQNFKEALAKQDQLNKINSVLFCETNPIMIKYAAYLMNLCSDEIRLPLTNPSKDAKSKIEQVLKELNLI